jgi:hypothetical protein
MILFGAADFFAAQGATTQEHWQFFKELERSDVEKDQVKKDQMKLWAV